MNLVGKVSEMIIAIDYDGTIGDANRVKSDWISAHLGQDVPPWDCNYTDCVKIIGAEACKQMGKAAFGREGTLKANEVPGALAAIKTLCAKGELYVVTARNHDNIPYAQEWLDDKRLLACFQGFRSSSGTTKAAVCAEIGADVLIDDDPRHLCNIEAEGLLKILLQDGRLERRDCGSDVVFCSDWAEVLTAIDNHRSSSGVLLA